MKAIGEVLDVRPYQLMHIVCKLGQGRVSDLADARLTEILRAARENPMLPLRLRCNTYALYRFQNPGHDEDTPEGELVNAKRDLDILQRMGLVPGSTRPAIDLFRRLLEHIPSAKDICGYGGEPGGDGTGETWSNAADVTADDYEKGRALGIEAIIPPRGKEEMARVKEESVKAMYEAEGLRIRPHHLMCMTCFHGRKEEFAPIAADNLFEAIDIMQKNPEVPVTLIQGCCMICPPCPAYHPPTGLCIGGQSMGLRDHKKDLDVLHLLGLQYGDVLPARELLNRLYAKVASTTQVCGCGDGVERGYEWRICGGPQGNAGYVKARAMGLGVPGVEG